MSASLQLRHHRHGAIHVLQEVDDVVVLALEGDFDRHDAPALGEQLDRALGTRNDLVLDLSEVTFIDSSIINELFRAARAARENGQTAVVQLGTAPVVERILRIVGIETVVRCAHHRDEAIELIGCHAAPTVERGAATG